MDGTLGRGLTYRIGADVWASTMREMVFQQVYDRAMSFFDRNRKELASLGIEESRLPPGQYHTKRFPVLHAGSIPEVDLATWDFAIDGLVAETRRWEWSEIEAIPAQELTADIHCVTKWSKFDTQWDGIPTRWFWDQIEPDPAATHVMVNAYHGL